MSIRKIKSHVELAKNQWDRYTSAVERGHQTYQTDAKRNEEFFLGAGRQWDEDVKQALEADGKPWLEENIIFSTINTILGYQTQSRMDIAFKPRNDVDSETAEILTKLSMFVMDQNKLPWVESQVFADGIIQQRGYFDIRINFDDNMFGDIKIDHLDPLDVIPDPDGKSYDPDKWEDVTVTKWLPVDDIKVLYGRNKWREVTRYTQDEPDFGSDGFGIERNRFADTNTYNSYYKDTTGQEHVRVLDRQWYKLQSRDFFFDLTNGELTACPDGITDREKKRTAEENDWEIINKLVKRVRWTVSTKDVILHDDWSPYDCFTIVPYFPYFRRGVTLGVVDNLIKTQEMVNKVFSQTLHVVNTTANSGWMIEENSLTNMDVEEIEQKGSQTGLVLEYKTGRTAPEKIQPNQIPTGLKDLMQTGVDLIRIISGVSETFQGGGGPEVSGTAIQSRVHQTAIQLAIPIDNLYRTRHMLAERILRLIQSFYTEERTILITDYTQQNPQPEQVTVNQEDEEGVVWNDVTQGKYDLVISDVPTQVTFQDAQFNQAVEMRKYGIQIPDDEIIKMSSLSRKNEIAERVSGQLSEEQQQQQDAQLQAQLDQLQATVEKLMADKNKSNLAATKSAAEIAQLITENPAIASIMDNILVDAEVDEEVGGGEQVVAPEPAPEQASLGVSTSIPQEEIL
jgi:hypothetical protein